MARPINKLSDVTCKAAAKSGLLGDGGGLYLCVKASGSKSWVYVWKQAGKRREMGLGGYPSVSLAKARVQATACRAAVAEGRDPIAEKSKEAEPTFGECADRFLRSMESQWRNAKHRAQWRMTLEAYAEPIRSMRVSAVETSHVLKVLDPIWQSKPETASRLRGRVERVLDYAKAQGWRTGENPALWRGHLKNVLPARLRLTRGHHSAMPYDGLPAFVEVLQQKEALSARALEFLILTAARSGEVLGATWQEIDLAKKLWIIPARRMKAGKEHRVPLSSRAMALLISLSDARTNEFVFPGQAKDQPLSNMSFQMLLRRMNAKQSTVHGFRSSFRDWAGDKTHFARELAEQALAHRTGDATELAYRRSDALDKRRELMDAWAAYCAGSQRKVDYAG